MAKLSKDDILAYLKEATIIELNDLVKAIEAEFGISAAMPVAVAAGAPAAGAAAAAAEAPSEVSVILKEAGAEKIKVIKVVREITGLGLKEAKDLVDGKDQAVKQGIPPDEAKAIKAKLEEVGAKVEIK